MPNTSEINGVEGKAIAPFPERVAVELTPKCNLECPMCPRHFIEENDGFMAFELWKKIVDEITDASPQSVIMPFWRGESLLHPDFRAIIDYALSKAARVHVSTNGHIMTRDIAQRLLAVEFVNFSVHSPHGFRAAQEFIALRSVGRPTVQISFVEGETTSGYIDEIVAEPDLFGFDGVRLYAEHTKDGVFGQTDDKIREPRIFCSRLQSSLSIAFDGAISRCKHLWMTDKGLNANQSSIREIWGSQALALIRDSYPDETCAPCDQWGGHTRGQSWRIIDNKAVHKIFG